MRELIPVIETWIAQNKQIALATVIDVFHSAPRGVGAKMIISSNGEMSGSVSAGCVEGAVVAEALQVIKSGKPKKLHYGIADEQAWDVGLTCGGNIDIYLEPLQITASDAAPSLFEEIREMIQSGKMFGVATVMEGEFIGKKIMLFPNGTSKGSTGNQTLDEGISLLGNTLWGKYRSELMPVMLQETSVKVFFDIFLPKERMIIIGAAHIAIHLVSMAKEMGFHTIVIDPRAAFANRERFPHVDELYQRWPQDILPELNPDASTYLVVLSHDAKIDIPALDMGLKYPFRYIGLLGSRPTQENRKAGLREMGYNEDQLNCIHGPIGIAIGSRLPDEIAVSILAEIVAVRRGKIMSKAALAGPIKMVESYPEF
jgi:xanthine dehydrogenase accessory factor